MRKAATAPWDALKMVCWNGYWEDVAAPGLGAWKVDALAGLVAWAGAANGCWKGPGLASWGAGAGALGALCALVYMMMFVRHGNDVTEEKGSKHSIFAHLILQQWLQTAPMRPLKPLDRSSVPSGARLFGGYLACNVWDMTWTPKLTIAILSKYFNIQWYRETFWCFFYFASYVVIVVALKESMVPC